MTSDRELVERVREHGAEVMGAKRSASGLTGDPRYSTALLDWLACAARGARRARRPRRRASTVTASSHAGTAGHVLDFDDTYLPGIAHLSAPTAPAALVVAAELGSHGRRGAGRLRRGFEAMGAARPRQPSGPLRPRLASRPRSAAAWARPWRRRGCSSAPREPRRGARPAARPAACGPRSARTASRSRSGWPRRRAWPAARLAQAGARVPLERGGRAASSRRTGGRYAEPPSRSRAARSTRQLDQGLALLPADPRRDRGRRRARRRRARAT